jgi:hypothetical protein
MSIKYYATPQSRTIGLGTFGFNVIIDGNNGTAEKIYEFVQWELRQASDIDTGTSSVPVIGETAQELLQFIGDTLRTKLVVGVGGVYINNFISDTNRLEFTDSTGVLRTFPFVAVTFYLMTTYKMIQIQNTFVSLLMIMQVIILDVTLEQHNLF